MAPLGSVLNFTITWHHLNWLQIWPLDGATCHLQEDNFAIWSLVHCFQILATTWRYLQWLQICSTGGATCISCKFGHQVAQNALVQHLVIMWRHLHCFQSWTPGRVTCIATLAWIAYWHYQLVLSWYLHQPESHQLSLQNLLYSLTDIRTQRSDPRFTWVR